ncbi:MAG: right-handed parallel beta-helix repeat-containing protein [Gemmatimonadota bacterium]
MPLRLALLSALLLAAAGPVPALRFYVDGASGAGDDRRSVKVAQNAETPWRTITHALRVAHLIAEGRPHVIRIAAGTYTAAAESFPLRISQTGIYLESGGVVALDGQLKSGLFEITAPTSDFLLSNMSFLNGSAERGGVVYCQTCSLRVTNNKFIGNRSTLGGDLIYQSGGRLKFYNNNIRYNGVAGSTSPTIEVHNTFTDTSQRDLIRNNTFYHNETPVILTSGNRTDISSNIFNGTSGSRVPAILDSASVGPLVRYNLFWAQDVILVAGRDSIKVTRVVRDTLTLAELGVQVPSFVTNQPDTVAKVGSPYEYRIQIRDNMGDKYNLQRDARTPAALSVTADGLVRWTPTAADTGRHEVKVELITLLAPPDNFGFLTYNIRVYTAASFPDTTSKGPQVTVTFVPDTTGAIDSLNALVPVFSSAASAGHNKYGDPKFLNVAYDRFELSTGSPGLDAGNPVVAMQDAPSGGRVRANDMGDTGGPANGGPPTVGAFTELTIQALPDSVATEESPGPTTPPSSRAALSTSST